MDILSFRKKILGWYAKNRRDMPWRRTRNPYKILVSEIMLQQTQVARVLPKYKEFLREFPTLSALARASDKRVLAAWQGLGYWRRALYLKKTAKRVVREHKGKFPRDIALLETFPGIGPYTARAVACFAFGSQQPFLDTNIRRLYIHFFFPDRQKVSDKEILPIAERAVWKRSPREWHYALFDYGAMVLTDKTINRQSRNYRRQSPFAGSFRAFRAKVVRFLLAHPQNKTPHAALEAYLADALKKNPPRRGQTKRSFPPREVIDSLRKDGLIKKTRSNYSL